MSTIDRDAGVWAAIEAAGGVTKLAELLKISTASVSGWKRVPAERALEIERLLNRKVTRHDLRPDLYPDTDPTTDPSPREAAA